MQLTLTTMPIPFFNLEKYLTTLLDGHLHYQQQMAYGVSSGLLPQQSPSMIAKYIDCFSLFYPQQQKGSAGD
jgi:hypothetical protein